MPHLHIHHYAIFLLHSPLFPLHITPFPSLNLVFNFIVASLGFTFRPAFRITPANFMHIFLALSRRYLERGSSGSGGLVSWFLLDLGYLFALLFNLTPYVYFIYLFSCLSGTPFSLPSQLFVELTSSYPHLGFFPHSFGYLTPFSP